MHHDIGVVGGQCLEWVGCAAEGQSCDFSGVPGKEFGMEGHIRISFAGSVKDVTEGIARIKWALDATSPNEIYIGDKKMIRDWM